MQDMPAAAKTETSAEEEATDSTGSSFVDIEHDPKPIKSEEVKTDANYLRGGDSELYYLCGLRLRY